LDVQAMANKNGGDEPVHSDNLPFAKDGCWAMRGPARRSWNEDGSSDAQYSKASEAKRPNTASGLTKRPITSVELDLDIKETRLRELSGTLDTVTDGPCARSGGRHHDTGLQLPSLHQDRTCEDSNAFPPGALLAMPKAGNNPGNNPSQRWHSHAVGGHQSARKRSLKPLMTLAESESPLIIRSATPCKMEPLPERTLGQARLPDSEVADQGVLCTAGAAVQSTRNGTDDGNTAVPFSNTVITSSLNRPESRASPHDRQDVPFICRPRPVKSARGRTVAISPA